MTLSTQASKANAPTAIQTHCEAVGWTRAQSGHLNAERGMRRVHLRHLLTFVGIA